MLIMQSSSLCLKYSPVYQYLTRWQYEALEKCLDTVLRSLTISGTSKPTNISILFYTNLNLSPQQKNNQGVALLF